MSDKKMTAEVIFNKEVEKDKSDILDLFDVIFYSDAKLIQSTVDKYGVETGELWEVSKKTVEEIRSKINNYGGK